ncbi:MAG: DUF3108 domain-containing protein [Bacteroidota bacterium]
MKVFYPIFLVLIILLPNNSQKTQPAFQDGEWFRFRMSYSNWLKAGNATLSVSETKINGKDCFHVVGKGWTTGMISWFFKVEDQYESYFDAKSGQPYKFIRKIDEGGYTKDIEIAFNHDTKTALVHNKKKDYKKTLPIEQNVQDMVSAYYFLRNNYDIDEIKEGQSIELNMFFDEENYIFKLKFLGYDTIKTDFGKVRTIKFRPYVLAGRVFKEEESLTLWVTADKNKIPLRIKADLAVGSLRADLDAFKGLKHSFQIIYD